MCIPVYVRAYISVESYKRMILPFTTTTHSIPPLLKIFLPSLFSSCVNTCEKIHYWEGNYRIVNTRLQIKLLMKSTHTKRSGKETQSSI